jgi:hypothetical protein
VHQGERIMMQARNLMQEKDFDTARDTVADAQTCFARIEDEIVQVGFIVSRSVLVAAKNRDTTLRWLSHSRL